MTETTRKAIPAMSDQPAMNTDPPDVRCGMCGGRCRPWRPGWIECKNGCAWSSHDPRRRGLWWRLRVALGH